MHTLDHIGVSTRFSPEHRDALLINVLSSHDFARAHIPGSINIPENAPDFVARVSGERLSEDQDIIVYCSSAECPASELAAKKLRKAGLAHIYDFAGGIQEWEKAGNDIEMAAMDSEETDQVRAQAREDIASQPPEKAPHKDEKNSFRDDTPDFLKEDKDQAGEDRLRPH